MSSMHDSAAFSVFIGHDAPLRLDNKLVFCVMGSRSQLEVRLEEMLAFMNFV
jgi:hypothetical protein